MCHLGFPKWIVEIADRFIRQTAIRCDKFANLGVVAVPRPSTLEGTSRARLPRVGSIVKLEFHSHRLDRNGSRVLVRRRLKKNSVVRWFGDSVIR